MILFLALLDSPEEQERFTEIYEQYRHFMWYVANQKLQDAHLAEDAVQEAFVALTRHLDKVEDVHSPRTKKFLATIVKSKAVDILRKEKPAEELTEYLAGEQPGTDILAIVKSSTLNSCYCIRNTYGCQIRHVTKCCFANGS